MPEISRFLGIVIAMYYNDHEPPHFHVSFQSCFATVAIHGGAIRGYLPPHVKRSVETWRRQHEPELAYCWGLARDKMPLIRIPPLA